MYNFTFFTFFILLASQLVSCSNMEYPKAEAFQKDDNVTSLSYTADLRAVHLIKRGEDYWLIAEPTPDAAFSYDEDGGMDIDLSLLSIGDKTRDDGSLSSGAEDLPLTGRASYVLLARELNYRMNEMALNLNLTTEQYMEMFKASMDTIEKVALIEAAQITTTNNTTVSTGVTAGMTRNDSQEQKKDVTTNDTITEDNDSNQSSD